METRLLWQRVIVFFSFFLVIRYFLHSRTEKLVGRWYRLIFFFSKIKYYFRHETAPCYLSEIFPEQGNQTLQTNCDVSLRFFSWLLFAEIVKLAIKIEYIFTIQWLKIGVWNWKNQMLIFKQTSVFISPYLNNKRYFRHC